MKQKKTVEDYLKAIYIISKRKKVHGADIAAELKVSRPTVSVALRALSEEGYLFLDDKTREVHLTDMGNEIAEEICERHDTVRKLLVGLGVDEETASADACEIEHLISAESYEAFKALIRSKK